VLQPYGSLVDKNQFLAQTALPVTISGLSVEDVRVANSEAALLPLGLMVRAKRMQQGTRDMLIARDGEELVCPRAQSVAA
jgi:hypothetical protein